jgi:hypothetical protein
MLLQGSKIIRSVCLGLSAGTGGLMAVWADAAQKPMESNDIDHLTAALGRVMGGKPYEWIVVLVLIGFSVAISFIFSADSNKKAFYTGASILAIMMTATPYTMPAAISAPPGQAATPTEGNAQPADPSWWDRWMVPAQVFAQGPAANGQGSQLTVRLDAGGKPISAAVFTIFDATGQTIVQSKVSSSTFTFYLPNRAATLRVQVDGYAIEERSLSQKVGPTMDIALHPTNIPLSLQRLFRK